MLESAAREVSCRINSLLKNVWNQASALAWNAIYLLLCGGSNAYEAGLGGSMRCNTMHRTDSWLRVHQLGDADQVVGDQIEHEVSGDADDPAMLGLAHRAMLLAPAEDALDHRATRA